MDGGASWVQQYTGIPVTLTSVAMIDSLRIIAVGYNGMIAIASNSGKTWDSVNSGISDVDLEAVSVHGFYGIAVGAKGTIVSTSDRGHTWHPEFSGVSNKLYAARMIDDTTALAVGAGGIILKTMNGGLDWVQVSPPSSHALNVLSFQDPETPNIEIVYNLPQLQNVTVIVYNVMGKQIAMLASGELQQSGPHHVVFNGSTVASGTYLFTIKTNRYQGTGKFELTH